MVAATGPAMKLAASMTRRPVSSEFTGSSAHAARLAQQPQREERDADADGGVRHVERRPVPRAPVDVDEVHHRAEARAVDQVADGAAEDETDRDDAQRAAGGQHAEGD